MQFMVTYTLRPEHRGAALQRFLETGAPPPSGVKLIGRWHDASLQRGFALIDATGAEGAAQMSHQWADLLTLEILAVIDDQRLGEILASK